MIRSPFLLAMPQPRRRALALLLGALLAGSAHGGTEERIAVAGIRPLLLRATAEGSAKGVLTGAGADYLSRRFETSTPIEIDVQLLHRLPQSGCARFEVTTRQREVLELTKRSDQELIWQISFCRDGRFPEQP